MMSHHQSDTKLKYHYTVAAGSNYLSLGSGSIVPNEYTASGYPSDHHIRD